MLSINTNISSYIAQRSLKNSTQLLNQAIERMTTGYKLNHASDNAANYSISTNQTTKLSAYQVAEDNASMGLDFITTANDSLNLISEHLTRIRDLAIQAGNGTYGEQSLEAINAEVNSRIDEIERLYNTSEYNGIKLFTTEEVSKLPTVIGMDETEAVTSGTYSISTAEELVKLATMTNNGLIGQDCEFILANDIDLSAYSSGEGWTPIGNSTNPFKATFNGNGYTVKNLTINRPDEQYQGFFSELGAGAKISNLSLENVNINAGSGAGALFGHSGLAKGSALVENCHTTGTLLIKSGGGIFGLAGGVNFKNCYSTCTVTGKTSDGSNAYDSVGGFGGYAFNIDVENCYAMGNISSSGYSVGGFVGGVGDNSTFNSSYATGNVITNKDGIGGFLGAATASNIIVTNCYSTGNIQGWCAIGGFIGRTYAKVENCYSTGDVTQIVASDWRVGSFIGESYGSVTNSYSEGTVTQMGTVTNKFIGSQGSGFSMDANSKLLSPTDAKPFEYTPTTGGFLTSFTPPSKIDIPQEDTALGGNTGPNKKDEDDDTNKLMLQVGINSSESSQITLDYTFVLGNLQTLRGVGLDNNTHLSQIDSLLSKISSKQTEYGACQNRLESALDEISTHYENLASSRSTLRDADIAKVSSEYIRQQILQQASVTLLSTANQTPSIALQLL